MTADKPFSGLIAHNLTVRYGRTMVLDNLTTPCFPHGHICALLGPNGSGKSTLLRAMSGLLPAQGCVTLDGMQLTSLRLPERSQHCLYLPQALPAPVNITALEAMLAAKRTTPNRQEQSFTDTPNGEDIQVSLNLLEQFNIAHLALRKLNELSGGQRQLIGLAQALGRQPHALLLDEPLSALDLHYQYAVTKLLTQITRANNLVTLMVLHDLNIALNLCDLVCVLHEGRIIASGPPAEVLTPTLLRTVYRVEARIETTADNHRFIVITGCI
ncbi:ABC transporter ATP-binding protein [Acetobacter ascendens]|uniref:Iron ABC transporter ATP-binding protein n=1 Tax=Acetobacter ascendens TaxID=481146 RepID=A0A1D8QWZ6_9PROT|nr:ABC transporter ATP-binding protein [Acetobacter ascendens]AOW46866.1 iron ABC transporter ATP-binding protein [Acetobacter ascendens]AOW49106.1 iron ABC transporter ATP-binding protein [Acetobacter ascendens]